MLDGKPVDHPHAADAIDAGIVYLTEDRKRSACFSTCRVRDNINLGVHRPRRAAGGVLDLAARRRRARRTAIRVARASACRAPQVNVGSLSGGNQQKVLLSRLLETRPRC